MIILLMRDYKKGKEVNSRGVGKIGKGAIERETQREQRET